MALTTIKKPIKGSSIVIFSGILLFLVGLSNIFLDFLPKWALNGSLMILAIIFWSAGVLLGTEIKEVSVDEARSLGGLKTRIKGRIVLIILILLVSWLLSGTAAFCIRLFGGSIGWYSIFQIVFPTILVLYAIWYLIYKIVFETWVNEFNRQFWMGRAYEASIDKANEKSRIRPPLKMALRFAKNQRYWEGK